MKLHGKISGDPDLVVRKTQDAIEWIQRRLYEFYSSMDDVNQEDITFGDVSTLAEAFGFPVSGEEKKIFDLKNKMHLCSSAISNGVSNISFRIWNKKMHNFTHPSDRSRNNQAMDNSKSGVFVKVALPFVRWSRNHKLRCNPNRLHREYLALERVRAILPHAAPRPFLYGKDEVRNDDSSYLIMEYISEPYQYYTRHLNHGEVDVSNIRHLGHMLAKIHCVLPSMFGGKNVLQDKGSLEFIAIAHYKKLRSDVEQYVKHSSFQNPVTGKMYPFSDKAAKEIRSKPEILRAISRHFKNFTDPPPETGTFVHLDFHTLNIFSRQKSFHTNRDQMLTSSNDSISIDWKICDMEFSNWGPAGADVGLFIGSLSFYGMVYACQSDFHETKKFFHIISTLWNSYKDSYLIYSKERKISEFSVCRSLYFIAHEVLGWAGIWLFRFSLPHLFYTFTIFKSPYPLNETIRKDLKKISSKCKNYDGLEMLRETVNAFAIKIMMKGFGDECSKNLSNQDLEDLTFYSGDALIFSLIETLEMATKSLSTSFKDAREKSNIICGVL